MKKVKIIKDKVIKNRNFDFLIALTDDELDLLAGGKLNNQSDFHQAF
jgi:hypothetical protein